MSHALVTAEGWSPRLPGLTPTEHSCDLALRTLRVAMFGTRFTSDIVRSRKAIAIRCDVYQKRL